MAEYEPKVWAAISVQAVTKHFVLPGNQTPQPTDFNVIPMLFQVPEGKAPEAVCGEFGLIPGVNCVYIRPASEGEIDGFYEANPDKRPAVVPAAFTEAT